MIRQIGFKALIKELGVVGTAVFIRQFENGYGNYTEERDAMLRGIEIDDIVVNIQKRKQQKQVTASANPVNKASCENVGADLCVYPMNK